ncbi:protein translocase subunit SecDF [Rhizobium sp. Root1220]|uniref:protein translocase subunit SecDF n=1 Tax=Rhizobium sp. Root1220 TaxID=1736432 RepID=UPI0006FD6A48|nr:protein translocase subunit SecDF [Rhizobium sp. Root1220]KQV83634.1 preprotein translocase subunit SecD [Rhizobium sp. Root1220]
MFRFSRLKTVLIWIVVLVAVLLAASNLLSEKQLSLFPSWLPHNRIALGPDLQGGSHLLFKVERADVVKERLESTVGDIRARLRKANIRYTGLTGNDRTVTVKITDAGQVQAATDALKELTSATASGLFGGSTQNVILQQADDGQLTLQISDASIASGIAAAQEQSLEVVRKRVAALGASDFAVRPIGSDRIDVQVLGSVDVERLKNILSEPAKLSVRMLDESMSGQDALSGRWPATSEVLYSLDDPPVPYLVDRTDFVTGKNIVDVQSSVDAETQAVSISYKLDAAGTERLAQMTRQNIGRHLAILFDDQVMAAPLISAPILGGSGSIPVSFTEEGAQDLALMLRTGALPATLTTVEERSISPALGLESTRAGLLSAAVAALLVVGLMFAFYRGLGVIAALSLVLNLVLIFAVLSLIGATLTLPGIAGIVLTIGMAVDANVLIYERIREEAKTGRPFSEAVESGFSRAFMTIFDANVTIFIASVILYYLGNEAVRGFAVTLAAGILTTVFTAFTLTRWIVVTWLHRRHPRHLPKDVHTGIFDRANIRFMGIRRYTFTVSAALSIAAMLAFAMLGTNLGVDFAGGSLVEVKAKQGAADPADIRARLGDLNIGDIDADRLGDASLAVIRIQAQGGGENAEQSAMTLVRDELGDDYDFRRVEVVGPAVSWELTRAATLGVLASLAVILVYIWMRFAWQFAVGAVIAALHDIILTLGLFVVTGMEFNVTSIAAILTVVGYSLNDTVVVYDRMRENLKRYRKMPLPILIDASINQTLSRTVLTAATTLLALAALCLFGGEIIRPFAFVMLFGVAVGTFSSIYIAAPVLIVFKLRPDVLDNDPDKKVTEPDARSGNPAV